MYMFKNRTLFCICLVLNVYKTRLISIHNFYSEDKVPDTGLQTVHTVLKLAHFSWTGHVTKKPDERLAKEYSIMENLRRESAPKRNVTKTINSWLENKNLIWSSFANILKFGFKSHAFLNSWALMSSYIPQFNIT